MPKSAKPSINDILTYCQSNHNLDGSVTEIYEKSSTVDELEGGWKKSFIFLGSCCEVCISLIESNPDAKFLLFNWDAASKWLDEK